MAWSRLEAVWQAGRADHFVRIRSLTAVEVCKILLMNSLEVIAEEGRSIVTSILSSYPYKLNQVNSIKRHVTVNGFRLRGTMVPGDSTNVSVVVNREATAW